MSDLRDELAEVIGKTSVANDGPDWGWLSGADSRCLADAILPIIERETDKARRAWTAEHHRAALQLVTEIDCGLRLADMEVRRAQFSVARHTIATLRGLLQPLEQLIQRRPIKLSGGES